MSDQTNDQNKSYDQQLAEAIEYGRSLAGLPLKKQIAVKWENEKPTGEWEEGCEPPAMHTKENFAHVLRWLSLGPKIGGPDPKMTDVDSYILYSIDPDHLMEVWQTFFDDGLWYRADFLAAVVAEAIGAGLSRIFEDLPDYVFSQYRTGFNYDFNKAERDLEARLSRPVS